MSDRADQLDRLKAALADRYAIERELGRGGMATVCLCWFLAGGCSSVPETVTWEDSGIGSQATGTHDIEEPVVRTQDGRLRSTLATGVM